MKILHMSDLHLGKRVNEFPMTEEQKYILGQIESIAQEEQPDAIVIAGDVYNTPTPPAEAVTLLNDFLTHLHALCGHIFILSGNHDSAEKLAFGAEIMSQSGVHFSRKFSAVPQKTTLHDAYGDVHVYMLPFVRPSDVRFALRAAAGEERGSKNEANIDTEQINGAGEDTEKIESYDDAVRKAIEQMDPDYSERNILILHQYINGGERTEGEDTIGGLDEVDAGIVKEFDYTALGHLHRPQHVQYKHIRYSGSPLKYSFSEVKDKKSVSIIELKEKGHIHIRERELTPLHDWSDLRGTYDELMSEAFYQGTAYPNNYVRITLTDEMDVPDAMNKLRSVYPLAMNLQYDNTRTRTEQDITSGGHIEEMTPGELVSEFFEKQNGQPMSAAQEQLITDLINDIF